MLFTYDQCMEKCKTNYQMQKHISAGNLFKLETGVYSDEKYVPEIAIIRFKYYWESVRLKRGVIPA